MRAAVSPSDDAHVHALQHALARFDGTEMGVVARTSLTLLLAPCAPVAKWPTRLWHLAVTEDPREQQRLEEGGGRGEWESG